MFWKPLGTHVCNTCIRVPPPGLKPCPSTNIQQLHPPTQPHTHFPQVPPTSFDTRELWLHMYSSHLHYPLPINSVLLIGRAHMWPSITNRSWSRQIRSGDTGQNVCEGCICLNGYFHIIVGYSSTSEYRMNINKVINLKRKSWTF